ncbi:hypothetical protein DPMN_075066 [Dreissena polymorpha]|uniref:Uncharacterized protein n=1 Tax=Dreissena polymorpha TaxID=45954 RepID=A0A9D4BM52_DREPO|nr:hypothetical protein DPMN_075066 [Dreissena polymorpha]
MTGCSLSYRCKKRPLWLRSIQQDLTINRGKSKLLKTNVSNATLISVVCRWNRRASPMTTASLITTEKRMLTADPGKASSAFHPLKNVEI